MRCDAVMQLNTRKMHKVKYESISTGMHATQKQQRRRQQKYW